MDIKYIEDRSGNKVLPITSVNAVRDANNTTLDTILSNYKSEVNDRLDDQDDIIETLNGNDVIPVDAVPAATDAEANKIYRLAGTDSYTDYMLDTQAVPLAMKPIATYRFPGIDDEPTAGSNNLVKSGGVDENLTSIMMEVGMVKKYIVPIYSSDSYSYVFPYHFKKGDKITYRITSNVTVSGAYFSVQYNGSSHSSSVGETYTVEFGSDQQMTMWVAYSQAASEGNLIVEITPYYSIKSFESKYNENVIPFVISSPIRATIHGGTGEISSSTTRLLFTIPFDIHYGKAKVQVGEGYQFVYREFSVDYSNVGIGDYLDLSKVTQGDENWITEDTEFNIAVDTKSIVMLFAKTDGSAILPSAAIDDNIKVELNNPWYANTERLNDLDNRIDVFTSDKANEYLNLFQSANGKVETFLFFSDPHYYNSYNKSKIEESGLTYIKTFKKYFDNLPLNFVLSGGDWLTVHNQLTAIQDLGQIDGYMNKLFNMKYYPVFGNHDNNYQGEMTGDTNTDVNDGVLSNQQMVNLWFRKWGKMYYTFKGTETRFYVFDSGIDWTTAMDDYKWGQVDWFAKLLLENSDPNIILVTHIAELDYQHSENFGNDITPVIDNVLLVAQAFNARESITLNGETYNFSEKSGNVGCLLCGHCHFDATAVVHGIPVSAIRTAMDGTFDLILVDYGTNTLKSVRVGTGSNRTISLA